MIGKEGVLLYNLIPKLPPLCAFGHNSSGVVVLSSYLYANLWMSNHIIIPVWVFRRARIGSNDEQAFSISHVHHGRGAGLAASGSGGGEQQQGSAFEGIAVAAAISAELLDQALVVVGLVMLQATSPSGPGTRRTAGRP